MGSQEPATPHCKCASPPHALARGGADIIFICLHIENKWRATKVEGHALLVAAPTKKQQFIAHTLRRQAAQRCLTQTTVVLIVTVVVLLAAIVAV